MEKRYFIYTFYQSDSRGGCSGAGYAITDGCFPSRASILNINRLASNQLNACSISEVKSAQDISDFLERKVSDRVNYPFSFILDEYGDEDEDNFEF